MSQRYTKEQLAFLRDGYRRMFIAELTAAFNERYGTNKTHGMIRSTLKNHKFKSGRAKDCRKGVLVSYTQEQAEFIRTNYARMTIPNLTRAFNKQFGTSKTSTQLRAFTKNHKIKTSRTGQFEKGNTTWNTGTKGVCKANSGSFKKGNMPANEKPMFHERVCDGYILIKVPQANPYTGAPTRYIHKQLWVWEQAHGKVPAGMVVSFIDGNKLNCALDNLELITRAELLSLNRHEFTEAPDHLKPTVRAMAKLEAKRFELQKDKNAHCAEV